MIWFYVHIKCLLQWIEKMKGEFVNGESESEWVNLWMEKVKVKVKEDEDKDKDKNIDLIK